MANILEIQDLKTYVYTDEGVVRAVDGVDLELGNKETIGIVGESGCGKSMTSMSIMRIQPNIAKVVEGSIRFLDRDVLKLSEREMRGLRGNEIGMIFQEPMTSLNPSLKIGDQISEPLRKHRHLSKSDAWQKSIELLEKVGILRPEEVVKDYPHHLSGGMRQRVMIAMALSCHPKLLIADEPTTALDVTIQAQILDMMNDLQNEFGMSIILITHDLGVVSQMCNRIYVMYLGKVVEEASVNDLFESPSHPYTQGLLDSMPIRSRGLKRLPAIKGSVPGLLESPKGCKFSSRCSIAEEKCWSIEPDLSPLIQNQTHKTRCWLVPTQQSNERVGE